MSPNATLSMPIPGIPLLPPPPDDTVLTPLPPLINHPLLADNILTIIGPVIAYWLLSITFECFEYFELFTKYRLHTPAEILRRNKVGKKEVAYWVVIQQLLQMAFALGLTYFEGTEWTGHEEKAQYAYYLRVVGLEGWLMRFLMVLGVDGVGLEKKIAGGLVGLRGGLGVVNGLLVGAGIGDVVSQGSPASDWRMSVAAALYWYIIPAVRFWVALFLLDTWQYFAHRLMHTVPSLYRAIHSHHHRLYCPYAFGALYNHPVEGFILDTVGAGIAFKISGMTQQAAFFFFTFSTFKTVDDHCGYKLPWDPLQLVFSNNAEYHDIHHQGWGIKKNYSQPFFICWDRWLNTQWTGTRDMLEERYRRSREHVERLIEKEKLEGAATTAATKSRKNKANGATNGAVVMNGEKVVLKAAGKGFSGDDDEGEEELQGGDKDSGWDDNSSDGSGIAGERIVRKEEARIRRRRRAAAAKAGR